MISRHMLTVAFLLSSISHAALASDCLLRSDVADRIDITSTDSNVFIGYLLYKQLPCKYKCDFLNKSADKELLKYIATRYVTGDSLDVIAEVPSVGEVAVINTDQALEVGYVVVNDLLDKKPTKEVLADAGRTFVREKIVAAALWLVSQTNVESLLPNQLSSNRLYHVLRNEVARWGVDNLIARACNQ